MVSGAMGAEQWFAVAVLIIVTILNAGYFLPVLVRAFLREPDEGTADHGEAPLPMIIAVGITATLTLLLFLFPSVPLGLAKAMIGGI